MKKGQKENGIESGPSSLKEPIKRTKKTEDKKVTTNYSEEERRATSTAKDGERKPSQRRN